MQASLLKQALQMPDAYIFIDRLQAALELEKATRVHFYEIIDENQKMEFINGEIYYHSPVRLRHNQITGNIYELLRTYVRKKKLGQVGIEKLLVSLTRNDYEPDVCFWDSAKAELFQQKQAQFPAPDFVVEVLSESTAENDREIKYQDYESHGVREYWIVDPEKQILEQYVLDGEFYELKMKAADGIVQCVAITGLQLPVKALFDEEVNAQVLKQLWQE
ncbi:Uma2 family endonuclease [Spirosoma sp. BT702]|uniref:Uma2 family endonuclease n=1 Tax=Spirosoma profusum TaxID=2771354 RepID=A0A926Y547_9BACT|nr:Uma2 family endonuclease [Spirosoma profusum]MBD2704031.1 Uma2 family endonuclease [Spirosoma profusum]